MAAVTISFGQKLRALREERGLSQRELAERVRTGVSHLSRLETGDRDVASRDLLARLADALDDHDHELAAAMGRLPDATEKALLQYPRALSGDGLERRTLPALRRSDAATRSEEFMAGIAGLASPVEYATLCRLGGVEPTVVPGSPGKPLEFTARGRTEVTIRVEVGQDDDAFAPRLRFLSAHAVAHVRLETLECELPNVGGLEELASDMAACILAPRSVLLAALQRSRRAMRDADPWSTRALPGFSARVADALGLPGWLVMRRLAEESLLDLGGLLAIAGAA